MSAITGTSGRDARSGAVADRLSEIAARLSPTPEVLARMQDAVMAEFARAAAMAPEPVNPAAVKTRGATPSPFGRFAWPRFAMASWFAVPVVRRASAVGLAVALALGS